MGKTYTPADIIEEMCELEKEKFSHMRKNHNLTDIDTNEVMGAIADYFSNKTVLGITVGMQGSGKTTFIKKYFPEEMHISIDDDLVKQYKDSRTEEDEQRILDYMEFTGRIYPDWRMVGVEDWVARKVKELMQERLTKNKSVIVDGVYPDKETRFSDTKQAKEYGAYTICFLFDTLLPICLERTIKRTAVQKDKQVSLLDFWNYLRAFEMPIKKNGSPEKGLDLVLVLNEDLSLTSAYPPGEFERTCKTA